MRKSRYGKRRPKIRVTPTVVKAPKPVVQSGPPTIGWRVWEHPDFIWRCVEILGFAAAVWALLAAVKANEYASHGLRAALEANEIAKQSLETARQEAEEGRIINAWQVLTTPAAGSSGKREALETLIATGANLSGIDLSCKRMGAGWNPSTSVCQKPVFLFELNAKKNSNSIDMRFADLSGVDLSKAQLSGANIVQAQLQGTNLTEANLTGAFFTGSNLSNSGLYLTNFSGAILEDADLKNAIAYGMDLTGARLKGTDFSGAKVKGTNISAADFCDQHFKDCEVLLSEEQILSMWAWEDRPPKMFPDGTVNKSKVVSPRFCSAQLRDVYESEQIIGVPKGC